MGQQDGQGYGGRQHLPVARAGAQALGAARHIRLITRTGRSQSPLSSAHISPNRGTCFALLSSSVRSRSSLALSSSLVPFSLFYLTQNAVVKTFEPYVRPSDSTAFAAENFVEMATRMQGMLRKLNEKMKPVAQAKGAAPLVIMYGHSMAAQRYRS